VLIETLAGGLGAYRLGQASLALIFPIVGALLLGVGVSRRRAFNRWNSRDDERLLQPDPPGAHDLDVEFDPRLRDDYDPEFDDDDLGPRPSQPPGKGTVLIVIGAVVLVLGAGHVLSYLADSRASQTVGNVEVGQCITAQAYDEGRMNSEPVDCRRSDATMELVSTGDGEATCPDGSRSGPLYPALTNKVRTHCFALNLREGHCYAVAGTFAPANCIDPAATVKVAHRVDGTSEATGCPADGRVVSYPEPPRVYCFIAP
jgi:hypothetical protein